ncbi:hypothetical protein BgiBS90_008580, partial [Biomphalaria glabrata]
NITTIAPKVVMQQANTIELDRIFSTTNFKLPDGHITRTLSLYSYPKTQIILPRVFTGALTRNSLEPPYLLRSKMDANAIQSSINHTQERRIHVF